MRRAAALAATMLACAAAAPARAEPDLFSHDTFSGLVDLRLAGANGERSWVEGGYGKGRYSGAGDDVRVTPQIAEAAIVWKPRLTWDLSGVVHLQASPHQHRAVDAVEAYLDYKPTPKSEWRYGARLGMFYPPISLEHEDPAWGVTHTITPSAINTWIGEEVKVIGAEARLSRTFAGQEVAATAALFGYNDTSGTLLSLRGWALDDVKSTAFGRLALPALEEEYAHIWRGQAPYTEPTRELDGRIGFYGRLDWRDGPLALNLFAYDNAGNGTAVKNLQWSWDTRFWNAGASLDLDPKTRVFGQVMRGRTSEGFLTSQGVWIDVSFASAYLLATHSFGKGALTGRVDWFETVDHTFQATDNNDEYGWAFTGAYRYDFTQKLSLLVEAMYVTSDRYAREYREEEARQGQTILQSSLRARF